MHCPLCHEFIGDGEDLQLHYLLSCSAYSVGRVQENVQETEPMALVRFRWARVEPCVQRIVHLISSLAGPIALHWSDIEGLFESALTTVSLGTHSCQLAMGGDVIPVEDFEIAEEADVMYIIPLEEGLSCTSTCVEPTTDSSVEFGASISVGLSCTSTCVEPTTDSSVEFGATISDNDIEQDVDASESQPASEGCLSSTALTPSILTEVIPLTARVIKVHRANIRKDMLEIFSDPSILDERILLQVVFINSRGEEEVGSGSGLVRDLFSLFWKDIYQSLMVGEIERVPSIRHDYQRPQWEAIGRILMKGFSSCQYFPLMLSKTFFVCCLYGESEISEEMLMKSFMNFVSESEKNLIERCLNGQVDPSDDELCDLLSTFDCKKVVNANNVKGILTELAHKELIQKPQYVAECWKSVIPWLRECFPQKSEVDNLYERLHPTVSRVIACFEAEETNEAERDVMKHLKRFVRGLDKVKLGKFLQFVTGSDIMLCDHIYVIFTRLDGIERRPVAHTCTFTLEIPSTYQSFPEFREEFHSILEANTLEMDIV